MDYAPPSIYKLLNAVLHSNSLIVEKQIFGLYWNEKLFSIYNLFSWADINKTVGKWDQKFCFKKIEFSS